MSSRNTKQKEIILDILKHHRTHPTIQEIYYFAKKKNPSIGQATIYRNINKLVEDGSILRLPNSSNESYHYDINTNPHSHLICKSCGNIMDLFHDNYNEIESFIEENNNIIINKMVLLIEGICTSCKKK